MSAEQCVREGRLEDALEQLQTQVRLDPSNSKLRVFLFQLLCVLGRWDRALNQLEVCAEMDPGTLAMVQTYRGAVQCEAFRADVFAGRRSPLFLGEPEEWMALLVQALQLSAEGRAAESQQVRDRAFELAPTTPGTVNGEPFGWIADADPRLGPVLEVVLGGRYYWVPFHRVQSFVAEEPSDLRDLVWTAGHFTWSNGGTSVGLVPTRYPGTEKSEDGPLRLARRTEWSEVSDGLYLGVGQRLIATDGAELPLLEIRELHLETAEPSSSAPDAG